MWQRTSAAPYECLPRAPQHTSASSLAHFFTVVFSTESVLMSWQLLSYWSRVSVHACQQSKAQKFITHG